jgi:hypothetical protein
MALGLTVEITPEFETITEEIEKRFKKTHQGVTKDLLDEIELTQIQSYLSGSMPAPPPGSTYKRTFTLRGSSRRKVKRVTSRVIDAEWFTNLDYAPFVIGELADQAKVHQGRWKSLEEVVKKVEGKIPDIYEENWRKSE